MPDNKTRVDFNAPKDLVKEADVMSELLDTSRTRLLIDALRKELDNIAMDERFQHQLKEAYYSDRISLEAVALIVGTEEAMRMKLLRESLDREPPIPNVTDVDLPSQEEFYDGEIQTWHPDDVDSETDETAETL
jgi:hypothetical protein